MKDTLERRLERDLPGLLIRAMPPARPRFLELRPEGGRRSVRTCTLRGRFGTVAMAAAGVALLGTGGMGAKGALTGSLNPFVWSHTPVRSLAQPPPSNASNLGSTAGNAGQGSARLGGPTQQHGAVPGTNPPVGAAPSVPASQSPPSRPTHPAAPTPSPSPTSNQGHQGHGSSPHGNGRTTA